MPSKKCEHLAIVAVLAQALILNKPGTMQIHIPSDIIHTSGLLTASQRQQLMGWPKGSLLYSLYTLTTLKIPQYKDFYRGQFVFLTTREAIYLQQQWLEVVCQHRCAHVTFISKFPSPFAFCLLCTSINYSDKVDKPVRSYSKDKFIKASQAWEKAIEAAEF